MDIPRFSRENINPKFCKQDIGDSYQEFIHDLLLPEYPDLHLFPTRGKDGAIDLSQTMATSRTVIECKYISEDRQNQDCLSVWRNVEKKLKTHLADPDGPTKGQAQYEPWYRTNPPITEYIFCVSSIGRNLDNFDTLNQEIKEFFTGLGKYEHLSHLKELSVKIIDWSDCCSKLKQHPNLIYRWFPRTLPPGLVPLDDSLDRGTFRSYLTTEKLPYYSLRQHLKTIPATHDLDIPDEENLLNQLEDGSTTGLIITGSGGVGKTRMMLEIGRVAKQQGWSVLRVQNRIKEDAIEQLAERITPEIPVLLLIDYIETQKVFTELVGTLNDLNERLSLKLRYVASCRKSFYPTLSAISFHKQIDLSPIIQDSTKSLFEDYQRHIVYHILKNSGMEIADRYLNICNNKPILAVFVSYLHSMGRQPELIELLKEQNFGTWVSKRVQLSFGSTVITRELALIMALFPMQNKIPSHLDQGNQRALFDTLATDGWIEKIPVDVLNDVEMWVSAHDVMVDQILLSYIIEIIPATVDHFVNELLTLANKIDSLRSAILTLQRLIDHPALESLNWFKILDSNIKENIIEWRDVREMLIRTSLLSPQERISLLENQELWEGAENDIQFQNSLGWLIRWTLKQDETSLEDKNELILNSWLMKISDCSVQSNFILTWGLRFNIETFNSKVLQNIQNHPLNHQTNYLLVAWMESRLPLELIESSVKQWIDKFKDISSLSFIYQSWLDAGGNKELVQTHIESWLEKHDNDAEAQFVYKSWLDAGGNKELVQTHIESWLEKHGNDAEADYVYKSWLEAGGNKELVQTHIESWLGKHGNDAEAGFIYQSWLDAGGNKELVQSHIESWLEKHGNDAEAQFVYQSWLDAGGNKELMQTRIESWLEKHDNDNEAQFVYKSWLDAGGNKELMQTHIESWLGKHGNDDEADYVYKSWLDAGGNKELVQTRIESWLEKHGNDAEAHFIYKSWLDAGGNKELMQTHIESWLGKHDNDAEAQFVYQSWLDAGGNKELVQTHIESWLEKHGNDAEADYVYKSWLEAGGNKELVQTHIESWLGKHGNDAEAGFVYQSWLDAGGNKELVQTHIESWLEKHGNDAEAQFVYQSWLYAGGNKKLVQTHIESWLEKHDNDNEAQFVYKSWLDAGGNKELVQTRIESWLQKHGNNSEAGFIYKSWLDAGGNKELMQTHIESWLEKHDNDAEAQFVYQSWLDAGGNKELVQTHIESWLGKHGNDDEAGFVYKSWLDAGGNKELVQTHIESWLEKHGNDAEARFVYQSWLDADGNKELVQSHIESWLQKHGNDDEADYVYKSWLDAGGNKELVQTHIESWLGKHGNEAEADYVYKSWLEAGGDFSVVRSKALLWLDQNYDKPEAVYLTKFIAKQKDIPIDSVKSILKWCKKFHNNEDAIWRMTQLREHLLVEDIAEELILTSEVVLAPLITNESFMKWKIRNQITILFSYLIRALKINSSQLYDHVDMLLLIWLRNPNSYGINLKANNISIQSTFYVERIAEFIVSGALDISADYEPIGRFLSWVDNWDPKCKLQVKSVLASLKQDYPASNLWDIVEFSA